MEICYGILTWEFLTCLALALVYIFYETKRRNYAFWKDQNVPYVPPNFFFGSIGWNTVQKPLQDTETEMYQQYGRIYGRFEGASPVLSVGDPEVLKYILTKDFNFFPNRRDLKFHDPVMDNTLFVLEGEDWSRVRTIVSPAFTPIRLRKMYADINECTDVLVERFAQLMNNSETIDCQEEYGLFVLSTIANCAFGVSFSELKNTKNIFVEKSNKLFQESFKWRTYITILCPGLMKVLRLNLLNPETTSFYMDTINHVLDDRKRNNRYKDDFLQMMLVAEDNHNNNDTDNNNNTAKKTNNKGLTHDEMLSQSVTFFIAGYDSTKSLLSHLTYQLAMNQDYQEMVVEEMRRSLEDHGGELNYDVLQEMEFLEAMVNECLRMCPGMVRHERRAAEDYRIESKNIYLKKGTLVSIPVYAMHHDEEWYPEPEVFRPERFYPDNNRTSSKYNFLPFGNGQRMCVGMRFVRLQVKLCLAKILMKFQILPAPTTPETLGYTETRNVLTVNKVEVCLKEREMC